MDGWMAGYGRMGGEREGRGEGKKERYKNNNIEEKKMGEGRGGR